MLEFSANTQFVVNTQSCFSDTKVTGSIQGPSCQSVLEKELSEHCLHSVNEWVTVKISIWLLMAAVV